MAPDLSRSLTPPSPPPPPPPRVWKATTGPAVRESDAIKKLRQLLRLPPVSRGRGSDADTRSGATAAAAAAAVSAEPVECAGHMARARMRQALAKRVAWRMLKRRASPSPAQADEGSRDVLVRCCPRLPPGLRCALHQAGAPGRSWMHAQRGGGGAGEAVAPPRASARGGGWAFCEYARWRRHVWMPSRFYLERVEEHCSNGFAPMKCV